MTSFQYDIATQTLNGKVDLDRLKLEIEQAAISVALDSLLTASGTLTITFKVDLPSGEETTLDSLVSAHDGSPIVEPVEPEKVIVAEQPPFDSKTIPSTGQKLFQRVEGKSFSVTLAKNDVSGVNENILEFIVPYNQVKFNELEIIGGEVGDKVQLNVLDNDAGTISTVPKYKLNTFGGKTSLVNVAPDYYDRASNYDADLILGMYIQIIYETKSDKDVYVNYVLHEVV